MHTRFALWIAMAFAAVLGTGVAVVAQEKSKPMGRRVVGGEPTSIKDHPWQVGLQIGVDGRTQLCGGSIIAQKWVLTAAHCFNAPVNPADVRTKAGVTNLQREGTWVRAEQVIIHASYNRRTNENDIALVKLTLPVAGDIVPLAPAALSLNVGQALEVTGWGVTAEGSGSASQVLLKGRVPYADTAACNETDAYNGRITSGMLCAGYREGGVDSCQGDSGGPLVWRSSDGPVLIGVVSFGEGCARKLKYGVYTRVSAYRDWIDRNLAAER